MRIELHPKHLCLEQSKVMKVPGNIALTAVCHTGCIWLTQDGDIRDVILQAGESFTFDRCGMALLHAFERSTISFVQTEVQPCATKQTMLQKFWLSIAALGCMVKTHVT